MMRRYFICLNRINEIHSNDIPFSFNEDIPLSENKIFHNLDFRNPAYAPRFKDIDRF